MRVRVAIIVDRTGPGRWLADWLAEQACVAGYEVDLIDLAEAEGVDLEPWLEDAEAFVVVTPCDLPPGKPVVYPAELLTRMLEEIR